MTKPNNENVVLKPSRRESMTKAEVAQEIASLAVRIDSEMSPRPPWVKRPDGLEISASHERVAKLIVDNPRINREGKGEVYLDADPDVSNLPESYPR